MADPIILSTWKFGKQANAAAWPLLAGNSASSLDAVERACRAVEADPRNMTVGLGGFPDRSGRVTLDASIMLSPAACGSVCCLRRFIHPVSIARLVMERSPHVMLAGEGAERFALLHGRQPAELTTPATRAAWQQWSRQHPEGRENTADSFPPPAVVQESLGAEQGEGLPHNRAHDTIAVLAQDAAGVLAGACSTSGTALKVPGRVGDSPLIGHGLYVDPDQGAAACTGAGELIMGVCGSFLAVELMRRGASPADAATEVIRRIVDSYELRNQHQVAVIALAPSGCFGSAALRPGYRTAVRTAARDDLVEPECVMLR